MTDNYLCSEMYNHQLASASSPNLSFMSPNRLANPLLSTNRSEAEYLTATNTDENLYFYGDNPTSAYTGDWGFAALDAYFVGSEPFDLNSSPMEDWSSLEMLAAQRELIHTPSKDYSKELEEIQFLEAIIRAGWNGVAALDGRILENEERIRAIGAELERRGFHTGDTTEDDESNITTPGNNIRPRRTNAKQYKRPGMAKVTKPKKQSSDTQKRRRPRKAKLPVESSEPEVDNEPVPEVEVHNSLNVGYQSQQIGYDDDAVSEVQVHYPVGGNSQGGHGGYEQFGYEGCFDGYHNVPGNK